MVIKIGENPEHDPTVNKFLSFKEGHRGIIIAISKDGKQALVKSLTNAFDGTVIEGRIYLVEEKDVNEYPYMVQEWEMI